MTAHSTRIRQRRTQPERRAATRAKLLKAAGSVFASRGYHDASLEEIAQRAGLSKGAVYHHFSSKQELFLTLLSERLEDRLGDFERAFGEDAALRFTREMERDPRWAPLFFEFVAYSARDARARRQFAERFLRRSREVLGHVASERLREAGGEPALSADELGTVIDALANGMAIERLFDPDRVPEDLLGRAIELMVAPAV
jgi:AcrR family transcriptional regulator